MDITFERLSRAERPGFSYARSILDCVVTVTAARHHGRPREFDVDVRSISSDALQTAIESISTAPRVSKAKFQTRPLLIPEGFTNSGFVTLNPTMSRKEADEAAPHVKLMLCSVARAAALQSIAPQLLDEVLRKAGFDAPEILIYGPAARRLAYRLEALQ